MKCNIGNSEGRFWRFGGISTFKELFFLSFFFLDNAYLRVYLFESLPFCLRINERLAQNVYSDCCDTVSLRTCVLGRGCLMYTRKGDDQQASYRLCNLNPLHPILCVLFIFIHIIDCGYSVESFSDSHENKMSFYSL